MDEDAGGAAKTAWRSGKTYGVYHDTGLSMVYHEKSWYYHGIIMILSWYHHGIIMVLSLYDHEKSTCSSMIIHDHTISHHGFDPWFYSYE